MASTALKKLTNEDLFWDYDHLEKTMELHPWNDGIKKLVLKKGDGQEMPAVSLIFMHYISICEKDEKPFETTVPSGSPQRLFMDRDHPLLITAMFDCFMSMRVGEVSKFLISSELAVNFNFIGNQPVKGLRGGRVLLFAELIHMVLLPEGITFSEISKVPVADREKIEFKAISEETFKIADEGYAYCKESNYELALNRFEVALTICKDYPLSDEALIKKKFWYLFNLYSSCANCHLHLAQWQFCALTCEIIMNLDLPYMDDSLLYKVYYRYAYAKYAMEDYRKAAEFCSKALKQKPNSKRIYRLQRMIHTEIFTDANEGLEIHLIKMDLNDKVKN